MLLAVIRTNTNGPKVAGRVISLYLLDAKDMLEAGKTAIAHMLVEWVDDSIEAELLVKKNGGETYPKKSNPYVLVDEITGDAVNYSRRRVDFDSLPANTKSQARDRIQKSPYLTRISYSEQIDVFPIGAIGR
jgi:hypothetical protein